VKVKGLYQALGVSLYCAAVGVVMFNVEKIFGGKLNFFGPVAFLLLFSVSALICALIVFYEPYKLFFLANKKKEAIDLVVHTTAWLFGFFVIVLVLALTLA
jgi:hypothetical protein